MRAGLSTIQQTLTAEAAAVLSRSIAEAGRRGHGQTTPLHVAATLLAAPSGLLRQACVRSHPATSHPLQCRALELCFSVALDRIPSSNGSAPAEPPISNALMAALKRAQAHQRRGCPEQQQQPLLAVKVELEQLVVSILDDPGVSRVMREASFSSPAVKATIEHSLSSGAAATPSTTSSSSSLGLGYRSPARNLYVNPRIHQPLGGATANPVAGTTAGDPQRKEEVKKVLDILSRTKKRNPVLVGDSDQDAVMRDALRGIVAGGDAPPILLSAQVLSVGKDLAFADRAQIPAKINELCRVIEARLDNGGGGVILDLGDLKWLVEGAGGVGGSSGLAAASQQQQIHAETGRAAVAEMARLLERFRTGRGASRMWLVGTATCATYLRCQVYYPTMEHDWDLQAMPIAARCLLPGLFPRLGGNGILSSSVESLSPAKGFLGTGATTMPLRCLSGTAEPARRTTLCPVCMEKYEQELANLVAEEFEKSSSDLRPERRQALPPWLQIAPPSSAVPAKIQAKSKEQELKWKQSTEELLERWCEICVHLHPNFHPASITSVGPPALALPLRCSYNPPVLPLQPPQPSLALAESNPPLKPSNHKSLVLNSWECTVSPPRSPVRTELVLGQPKISETHKERVKDFATGCTPDQQKDKLAGILDVDSFKRLFTGLSEKVSWQPEAASAVATVVMQCKSGKGKHHASVPKSDTWLLFTGPDRVGKKRMVTALSELVCGAGPITINLGHTQTDVNDGESDFTFRGKTAMDKVAEVVRQNPFSVVMLEDFDRADVLVRSTLKCAIERGRLTDSYGREVSVGSVIFVLSANWLPDDLKSSHQSLFQYEEKIMEAANSGWQLELAVREKKAAKRRAEWLCEEERTAKSRKENGGSGLSLDLNLSVGGDGGDDDANEGSRNSSDLTVEHDHEHGQLTVSQPASSLTLELRDSVDGMIVFNPVDFGPLRQRVSESITTKFSVVMGNVWPLHINDDALDRIIGGVWLSGAPAAGLDEWAERVLVPTLYKLKSNLKAKDGAVVQLSLLKGAKYMPGSFGGDWLPKRVTISVHGLSI